MTRCWLLPAALALAGCSTLPQQRPLPPVTVTGPVFPASQFVLPSPPVAPDPATAGVRSGSLAARYENDLRASDRVCRIRLDSVGRQLDSAGQVVHLNGAQ